MPINEIVAEAIQNPEVVEHGNAPEDDGTPVDEPQPTTLNTGRMLPPYIHNQTLDNRGALLLVGSLLGIVNLVQHLLG